MITFFPYGDAAVLVNFEQKITLEINDQIQLLIQKLEQTDILGIQYWIPAYCSLTVVFDVEKTNYQEVVQKIQLAQKTKPINPKIKNEGRILNIPVCYDDIFAPDLTNLSQQLHLFKQEVIEQHTAQSYRVFMIGFLPGFPYMGILPNALKCHRKSTPRLKVPARSVGLAGLQTGIYPTDAPGGWQIIGKTPIDIFRLNHQNPFLFKNGDQVNFYPVSLASFRKIEKNLTQNSFDFKEIYD